MVQSPSNLLTKPNKFMKCNDYGAKLLITITRFSIIQLFLTIVSCSLLLANGNQTQVVLSQKNIVVKNTITVKGIVSDVQGPLPGVTVTIVGTKAGVSTAADGSYSIQVPADGTLAFSLIGYATQQIQVNNRTSINVTLVPSSKILDDVVVVGYGTKRRSDISGSVATVSGKELTETPVSNVSNALAGRLPGLTVTNPSGAPGTGSVVTIRGTSTFGGINSNAALTVVDGIVRDFQQLDPNEIESISVLKDASAAAVYGSRAANGVILITTKRGSKGKPQFQYSGYVGIQQPTLYPKLMTGYEYAVTKNVAQQNMGQAPAYTAQQLDDLKNNRVGTDWYDLTFKKNPIQTQQNLSVNGGSDALLYFMSLGYNDQKGMYDNINFNRLRLRSNVDAKINKSLTLSTDIDASLQKNNESGFSPENIFAHVIRERPNVNAYNADGSAAYNSGEHPAEETHTGYDHDNKNALQTNLSLKYNVPFITGLTAIAKVGVGRSSENEKIYMQPIIMYAEDSNGKVTNTVPFGGYNGKTALQELFSQYNTTLFNASLNYDRTFKKHRIGAMLLYEQFSAHGDNFYGFRTNFPANGLDELSFGGDAEKDANGGSFDDARKSYVGRLNYAFDDRYLLEFTGRVDGSVAFPESKKYGFFPAVSAGWRISEEKFMKNSSSLSFINNAKLRASYGVLGNDRSVYNPNDNRIPTFQYLQTYNLGQSIITGGQAQSSLTPGVLPNPNVTWETAAITDIGIELGMWNNKLTFEADAFHKHTYNILLDRIRSIPATLGATLPKENYAAINNNGIELILGHQNQIGQVSYFIRGNMSFNNNKVVTIDEPANIPDYLRQTGRPLGFITGYKSLGYFQSDQEVASSPKQFNGGQKAGDVKYADINGDGKVDSNDQTVISDDTNAPKIMYGLSLGVKYKGFDLNALFQGAARVKILLSNTARNFFNNGGSSNNFAYMLDYWTPNNPNAAFPRPWNDAQPNNSANSSLYLRDLSYIRLKSFELGYTLPATMLQKAGISKLRIYITGYNVFTWSKMKFFDPEISASTGAYYPQQRNINLGANLSF